ncbi:stage III sporulation protein AF [Brevibacillus sp. SYSU BS000544]|uniref:stage III sporulation protein AF n=1 Tax=Brevibacillus sp. SYSU BS000544 TaxID=3416443 RepID=UPI003CE4B210
MDLLTLWLKKIILLVLLAAFLDLILPNTNLQRYVKMVMGLIILMTILSPVFSVFNLSQEELSLRISQYQQKMVKEPTENQWKQIADNLIGQQDKQMTEYVTEQMQTLIRRQVENNYQVAVAAVRIKIDETTEKEPHIQAITIDIDDPQKINTNQISAIQPIKPIEIQIDPKSETENKQAIPASGTQNDPLSKDIATSVANEWNLEPHQVHVIRNDTKDNRQ